MAPWKSTQAVLSLDAARQTARRRSTDVFVLVVLGAFVLGAMAMYAMRNHADLIAFADRAADAVVEASIPADAVTYEMSMPVCASRRQVSCVIDGDTIRLSGERIRLLALDAPELFDPQCEAELALARRARDRLSGLLSAETWLVVEDGQDRYGRTLAKLRLEDGWAGTVLIQEGLARQWQGRRSWC